MERTKIVYQTDQNGFYIGETVADLCPVTDVDWLIPGGCSEEKPPIALPGQRARLIQGQWALVETKDL